MDTGNHKLPEVPMRWHHSSITINASLSCQMKPRDASPPACRDIPLMGNISRYSRRYGGTVG